MKAIYIGDESEPGSGETIAFGRTVRCGAVTEFPDGFLARISGNRFFEIVADEPEAPPMEPSRKAELIVEAEKCGVTIDKRWGEARITEALQTKLAELQAAAQNSEAV